MARLAGTRRRRVTRFRKTRNVPDVASLSESASITVVNGNLINTMYTMYTTSLSQYPRASLVAQGYQQFRIKSLKMTFKPPYDTYVSGAGTAFKKPVFYYMIDKAATIPSTVTVEQLKSMGARPRAFDEKPISVTWAPTVLEDSLGAGVSVFGGMRTSPWLSTNNTVNGVWAANTIAHKGIVYTVTAEADGAPAAFDYDIDLEAQFEFKKPLIVSRPGVTSATPATIALPDTDYDGRVGGNYPVPTGLSTPLGGLFT